MASGNMYTEQMLARRLADATQYIANARALLTNGYNQARRLFDDGTDTASVHGFIQTYYQEASHQIDFARSILAGLVNADDELEWCPMWKVGQRCRIQKADWKDDSGTPVINPNQNGSTFFETPAAGGDILQSLEDDGYIYVESSNAKTDDDATPGHQRGRTIRTIGLTGGKLKLSEDGAQPYQLQEYDRMDGVPTDEDNPDTTLLIRRVYAENTTP